MNNNKIVIETDQRNRQVLTKRQLAEIKLLQYTTIELEQRIREELENNPAFEVDETPKENEEEVEEPVMEDGNPDDYEESDDYIEPIYNPRNYSADEDYRELQIKDEVDVTDYLKSQLDYKEITERQKKICKYLIDAMDDRGFIERDTDDIVDDFAMSMGELLTHDEVDEAIKTIQTLEPTGVGARDLRECFLLQIDAMPEEKLDRNTLILRNIIDNHFKRLRDQNLDGLINQCKITEEDLEGAIAVLKKLNPTPLGSFGEASQSIKRTITPDFLIDLVEGRISITLNNADMPTLTINEWYRDMAEGKSTKDKKAISYAKDCVDNAEWFINAISKRDQTLMTVMKAMVTHQKDYFMTGDVNKLKPMKLTDISEITGLDPTSISRITSHSYMQCPYGIIALKKLFTEAAITSDGEDATITQALSALEEIIEAEDKKAPLSDQALCNKMAEKGYTIARRTITKYREKLNIPSAKARKILKILILAMLLPVMAMSQDFGNAQVGYMLYDMENNQTIAEKDPDIKMTPASVMKLFTTATVLEIFGGDYEFKTKVLTDGTISNGVLQGNLYIHGGLDPTIESKVFPDIHFFAEMIKSLKSRGISQIDGDIIADGAVIYGEAVSNKWVVEDLYTYYGVGCFGISLFDNVQVLTIHGTEPPRFTPKYPESEVTITSNMRLTDGGSSAIMVYTVPFSNNYVVEGALHRGNWASPEVAIPNPVMMMANYAKSQFEKAGITVKGKARESKHNPPTTANVLYTYRSPLLANIVREVNFNSNNHYAQHLFRLIGTTIVASGSTTRESTSGVIQYWKNHGVKSIERLTMYDGNGLSPMNAASPRMIIDVLRQMHKSESAYYFRHSLPRCGKEGTVKALFHNMPEIEAYAKSGSMTGVQAYAGYIKYKNHDYAFCVMVNEFDDERSRVKRNIQDLLVKALKNNNEKAL